MSKRRGTWRDQLPEILNELDVNEVPLGNFHGIRIGVGDGCTVLVSKWEDLDLAAGDDRGRIIDALRKYLD
jgi:hypothetical protein